MGMAVPEGNEDSWLAGELGGSTLPDQRLARRLLHIAGRMSASPGQPLPLACQDWAATKAAYRFFDNDRVTEQGVLAGHFAATKSRVSTVAVMRWIAMDGTRRMIAAGWMKAAICS
jgi:hypothetical protein